MTTVRIFRSKIHLIIWVFIPFLLAYGLGGCDFISNHSMVDVEHNIQLDDCQLSAPVGSLFVKAKCGTIAVNESPADSNGKVIHLNVAVIPAISRKPNLDPLFLLAGGPGEAATEAFIGMLGSFNKINQKRDIVLVDQRGTGKSNPLQCLDQEDESTEYDDEKWKQVLSKCLRNLDSDPQFYTTSIAMDDLDQVREALGYSQINLYGASYGTRAALVYMRSFPEHTRSVILDGVAPLDWSIGPSMAGDGQRALEMIFDRCQIDHTCYQSYASKEIDLITRFQAILGQLETMPMEMEIPHPISGALTKTILTSRIFANTVHFMSYTPETAALIPLMVDAAYERNDFSMAAAQFLSNIAIVEKSISNGMRFSVMCAEDVPFYDPHDMTTGYLGDYIVENFETICTTWPRGKIPSDFKLPVTSQAPILLISGEADPVTPPENALHAMKTLPNSLHLIAPGMGHINIFRGCIPTIATDFVESGEITSLNSNCVETISPMPFFLNYSGPAP